MIKTKFISFFLLLLMSIQVLPLASIGNMLSSNQWTEELPHGQADDTDKIDDIKLNHFLLPQQHLLASSLEGDISTLRIHLSSCIPLNHSSEILSPPPDLAA